MFMSLISHLLCAWFAFLLPCYRTYKTLAYRPLSEAAIEKIAMYWAVIGIFVAVESSTGWLLSWLPFYWEIRTLFLLYLSLPQTQGSTYIYNSFLSPFFAKNEAEFDAGIISAQSNVLQFCQARISSLVDLFWSVVNKTPITKQPGGGEGQSRGNVSDSLKGLWDAYGPAVVDGLARPSARSHGSSGGSNGHFENTFQGVSSLNGSNEHVN